MDKNINVTEVLDNKSNEAFRKSIGRDNEAYLHDSQINTARNIVKELSRKTTRGNYVNLIASPQMGKTGTCISVINILTQTKLDCIFGIDKFMFITGMNDTGLKSQTYARLRTQSLTANIDNIYIGKRSKKNLSTNKFFVLKNSDLLSFEGNINNTLIFIDESHYGSNERNVLTQFLEMHKIDWKNTTELIKRNIYIISISATPFDELVSDTADCKKMIQIEKSSNYIGISEYLKEDLVYEAEKDDIAPDGKIFEYIKDAHERMCDNNNGVGAIFIRTRNFNVIEDNEYVRDNFNIFEMYASGTNIQYQELDSYFDEMISNNEYNKKATLINAKTKLSSIKDEVPLITVKPLIILIKGAFRAGITINQSFKDYIYMIYDYSVKADTTAQALLGRMCGHRNLSKAKINNTHFYINKQYADMYSVWENDFTNKDSIPCNTMKYEWIDDDIINANSELGTKSCGNVEIPLTDSEIISIYKNGNDRKNRVDFMEHKIQEILSSRDMSNSIVYDYIGEVVISGKNNYAISGQDKRFNSYTVDSTVFQFRPYKMKKFMEDTNRDYLTKEDLGKKCISVVLDAEIYVNDNNLTIDGNKRLLIYYVEVGQKIRIANRKGMYKAHKDTMLVKTRKTKKNNETR